MRGVEANGLGGQNGYHVPEKEGWGGRYGSSLLQPAGHVNRSDRLCVFGARLSVQTDAGHGDIILTVFFGQSISLNIGAAESRWNPICDFRYYSLNT